MKIIHFVNGRANPNGTNGGDRVLCHLATAQGTAGHEVLVLGVSEKPAVPLKWASVMHVPNPRYRVTLPSAVKEIVCKFRPHVVHLHGTYTPRQVSLARWLRKNCISYCISTHGGLMPGVFLRGRLQKLAYLKLIEGRYLQSACFIHAVSEAEAEAVRRFAPKIPLIVAAHGIEGVDPVSLDTGDVRRQYPDLAGKRIFGFLGRLDPLNKGLDLIVDACAKARAELRDVAVILAGPEWKGRTAPLMNRVKELGLSDKVLFIGRVPDNEKFDFVSSCDVFLHPSRWEAGMPFSVLDALEIGRPCLLTNAPHFGNFMSRYLAGLQVPPTVDGVAAGLRYFAHASRDLLTTMGAAARRATLQEFSWEITAAKLVEAYERHASK
jgi:glycosyltransferase involved in cell wall biosynthesis